MGLFSKKTDEEFHQQIIAETESMLNKYYDKLEGQTKFPDESSLLAPNKIFATSIEKLNNNSVRIHVGYKNNHSGYVTQTLRMNYEIIRKGSLLCKDIISITELPFRNQSNIEKTLLSSTKTITFPVQTQNNIEIKCKKIFIENIGTFVLSDGVLITHNEFIKKMENR